MKDADITSVPFFALYVEIVDDLLKSGHGDALIYQEICTVSICFGNNISHFVKVCISSIMLHYNRFHNICFILQLLENLVEHIDPVRKNYWAHLKGMFKLEHGDKFNVEETNS